MEDFRSSSCMDGKTQIEGNGSSTVPASRPHKLRSYSTSHSSPQQRQDPKDANFKNKADASGSSSSSKGRWSFNYTKLKREKRIASYGVYVVEGKVKGSLKKSLRWLKDRLDGWR